MAAYLFRRIGVAVLILIGAGVTTSIALAFVPDPTPASAWQRIGANLETFFTFDYTGRTLNENRPVWEVLVDRSEKSITLIGGALMFVLLLGIPTGVLAALRPHHRAVNAWAGLLQTLSSMPVLVFGFVLILLATQFFGIPPFRQALPAVGRVGIVLIYLLPMLTLAFGDGLLADVMRTVRAETARMMEQDYIRALKARGVGLRRHLFQGLVAPIVATFAGKLSYLIGGSVIVEYVFGWQGLAYQVLNILSQAGAKDYPFILAATTLFVGLTLLLNLVSDITALVTDPRLRTA